MFGISLWNVEMCSSKAESGCLHDLCMASSSVWELSMVPESNRYGTFARHRQIHGDESSVWSSAQR